MSNDTKKLLFVLEKIEDISSFQSRYESTHLLLNDTMGFDATLMCLLQIGENINKLSKDYKELENNDIKGAYNVRNFIAHDYEGVNKSIIENILREYIPQLKKAIENIISKTGELS